jgi:hypothetical protein
MPDLTTRHRLRLARRVVAALTTPLLLAALGAYLSGHAVRTFSDLGMTAAALLGGVNCGLAAQSSFGRLRVAWGGLAAACLAWAVGQAIWS